jgi:hypothetical protein
MSRSAGGVFLALMIVLGLLALTQVIFAAFPLRFPDLWTTFAPWSVAAGIAAVMLLIARSRTVLLAAAVFGFASAAFWLLRLFEAASFYSGMIILAIALSVIGWLLALWAWFLAGSANLRPGGADEREYP